MLSEAANMGTVQLDRQPFHNLIPSRFPTVEVYERIAGGRDELFKQIEHMTNPREREKERLTRGVSPMDPEDPQLKNWNHAPFVYPNPEGSRFFKPGQNVMELASDLQTALAISVPRREAFLRRTDEPRTFLEMRQIVRPITGRFLDAIGWDGMVDRDRRIALGKDAIVMDVDGILFSPIERPSAQGVVVLRPSCSGKPDQADHFKYLWDGQRIHRVYSFGDAVSYDPGTFGDKGIMRAAQPILV